jgi:hypothetical protein
MAVRCDLAEPPETLSDAAQLLQEELKHLLEACFARFEFFRIIELPIRPVHGDY